MERFVVSILLVVLFAAPVPTEGRLIQPDAEREPESGVSFPGHLVPPGGSQPQRLVGTGIRQRTIFRVNVYALGLYVDRTGAETALAAFAGRPAASLARDDGFRQRVLELDFGMTLRLVLTRTLEGREVADAFDDALQPRIARATRDGANPGAPAALAQLRTNLRADSVLRGTEIVFSCDPAGRLTLSVGSDQRAPIESRPLCRALFDLYLGDDPIERDARRRIMAGFARLLAAGAPPQGGAMRADPPRRCSPCLGRVLAAPVWTVHLLADAIRAWARWMASSSLRSAAVRHALVGGLPAGRQAHDSRRKWSFRLPTRSSFCLS